MTLGNLNGTPRHVNGSRVAFLLAIGCFRTTLDLCYLLFLSTAFVDDPITPMPVYFAAGQYALSWIALLVVASLVPFQKDEFSGVFFLAAMAFLYIPMTSMVGLNHERPMSDVILAGLAVRAGLRIGEWPVPCGERQGGRGSLNLRRLVQGAARSFVETVAAGLRGPGGSA